MHMSKSLRCSPMLLVKLPTMSSVKRERASKARSSCIVLVCNSHYQETKAPLGYDIVKRAFNDGLETIRSTLNRAKSVQVIVI